MNVRVVSLNSVFLPTLLTMPTRLSFYFITPDLERVGPLHVHAVDEQPLVHRILEVVAVDGRVGDGLAGRRLKACRGWGDAVVGGGGGIAPTVEKDNCPMRVLHVLACHILIRIS